MIIHQVWGKIWYFIHKIMNNNNNKYCNCLGNTEEEKNHLCIYFF